MLRTTCPDIPMNISVITNFGCNKKCWYCVWKGHKLEKVKEKTDWDNLYAFLAKHKDKGKVSVSGGGDPLYRPDMTAGWWKEFLGITKEIGILVDVHTREQFTKRRFWRKHINRCVFSSDRLKEDKSFLRYLSWHTQVRITHTVTSYTTDEVIEDYLDFQKEIDCQFTIKQLSGYDDNGRFLAIREKYPDIYYLGEGDYNIYYMPDNSIRDSFLEQEKISC